MPHDVLNLHRLVHDYGYGAIFILTFLEGEAILVIGGIAAHRGYLQLHFVMLAAFLGTFLGDQLYFLIGYRLGPSLLERRKSWKPAADRLSGLLHRHEILLVLTFRFLYGLRTIASFVFGAARISKPQFLVLNAIGALIWAVTIGYGGFVFGNLFQHFFEGLQHYELEIAGAVLGIAVLALLLRIRRR